jgi:magnesium and cobalt transporter
LCEAFELELRPNVETNDFETIGGLIAHEMGHVPKRGESHILAGLRFVVLHTKGGAVRWFRVEPADVATKDTRG